MQRFQEGCLTLSLETRGVSWQGEATSVDGVLAQLDTEALPVAPPAAALPLSVDELLQVQGGSLQDLLEGLLSRQLIREPLALRYGLDSERLRGLRFAPFRLRLRPQPRGPFQASLELQVRLRKPPQTWLPVLQRLAQSLREQGFEEIPFAAAAALPPTPIPVTQATTPAQPTTQLQPSPKPSVNPLAMAWRRSDGAVVGGWRWIAAPRGYDAEVLFFLGPAPAQVRLMPTQAFPRERSLQLRARPQALDQLGLLPAEMPAVVRGSDQLWTQTEPLTARTVFVPVSRLRGGLTLSPCAGGVRCAGVRSPVSPP
jgi:hypothetical protein